MSCCAGSGVVSALDPAAARAARAEVRSSLAVPRKTVARAWRARRRAAQIGVRKVMAKRNVWAIFLFFFCRQSSDFVHFVSNDGAFPTGS